MDVVLVPLLDIASKVIDLYIYVIIIGAILTWLVNFNVVNTSNQIVYTIGNFCFRVTEPALRPIRRFLPNLGGIDLSPVVLILGLVFLQKVFAGIIVGGA